ncbi:MAG: EAL domain-containing protein [Halothiobacillaceae bacterium]|nr:EAL domain-containing protein [Halothiobacillaceae bacterium]HER34382.1 EAL domain-containing protein [Halothiobacillaceae bacterium]
MKTIITDTPIVLKSYLLMVVAAGITIGSVGLIAPLLITDPGPLGLPLSWESALAALLAGLGLGGHLQRWRALHYTAGMAILSLVGFSVATQGVDFAGDIGVAMGSAATPGGEASLSIEASLLLVAIALCLMLPSGSKLARRPWQWVGALMLFLGGVSALGMFSGQAPWLQFHSTAAWVAILFVLLFGGAMWLAPRLASSRLDDLGGLAVLAALLGSLLSAVGWYQFSLEHNRELQGMATAELDRVEIISRQVLTNRVETLDRFSTSWRLIARLPTAAFVRRQESGRYFDDMPSLQSLATWEEDGSLIWQRSRDPAARRLIEDLLANDVMHDWLRAPANAPRLRLLADVPSPGEYTSLVSVPMSFPGKKGQQLIAVIDFDQLLAKAMPSEPRPVAVQLSLGGGGAIDLRGLAEPPAHQALLAEREIALPFGLTLAARGYLEAGGPTQVTAVLPAAVALIGLAITQLIALLLATVRSRLAHARRLSMTQRELESQQAIQQMILHSHSLDATLNSICELLEAHDPRAHCSVMLVDEDGSHLQLAAAPSLPAEYRAAVAVIPLAEIGSCGKAACRKEPVFTTDIATDPDWSSLREVSWKHGLASCWSYPLLTSAGEILGTFATYRETRSEPSASDRRQVARAADLVSLAIERHRDRGALEENEQRYRSLFTYNPDAVFSLDAHGHLRAFNHATEAMFDRPPGELDGLSLIDLVDAGDSDRVRRAIDRTIRGRTQSSELAVNHLDGSRHVFDVTYLPVVVNGRIEAVYGIGKDITLRKRQERRLRTLERSVEASIHGVVIADARRPDLPIVYTNAAFSRITGYAAEEAIGRNCRFLQGEQTDPDGVREIREALAKRESVRVLLRNYRKDGSQFWNELHVAPVEDEAGEISHFVGLQNDVSEHKSYEAQLAFNATHDGLTGLANRALFEDRLRHATDLSRRREGRVAVLFIDLDEFKPINDSLGHAVGDKILVEVARRLDAQMRAEDTLARFGGDEFVALLADIPDEEEALRVAERLLPSLRHAYRVDGRELYLSASIGITISEPGMVNPLSLIQQADMAMYRAKQQGRNTCQIFNQEINRQVRRRVGLRNDLQEALDHEAFQVFYQPLVRGKDRHIDGFEALLRWHHPTHGWVSPATFIPLAEETGQIIPLSEWILERACRDMKSLVDQGLKGGRVAINLSPLQFHRPNFLDTIHRTLELTGLPADRLELELTEGILMNETESAIDTLHRLRDSTVSVSIDDFGTGFSSLSYLKHLPIDKIKIDRSFVQGVEASADDSAIVQGIISMAHHLGIKVVAEGIETEAQREILVGWGCDILQGYLFARPMPLTNLRGCLQENRNIIASSGDA